MTLDIALTTLLKEKNVILEKFERVYLIDLSERQYVFENTCPVFLRVGDHEIRKRSWNILLFLLAEYLQEKFPKPVKTLLTFRPDWSDQPLFQDYRFIANCTRFGQDLYMNTGYTAIHAEWMIMDLLDFYDIDRSTYSLGIHVQPRYESEEIRNAVHDSMKAGFRDYLKKRGLTPAETVSVSNGIDALGKFLPRVPVTANDFYTCDSPILLTNTKSRFLKYAEKNISWSPRQLETAHRYLDYLTGFFSFLGDGFSTGKRKKKD